MAETKNENQSAKIELSASTALSVTDQVITEYMDAFGLTTDLETSEKVAFRNMAVQLQLNPFKREIYCNAYGKGEYRRLSIVVGYEVYLKRAERIGLLQSWKVWTEGSLKSGKKNVKRWDKFKKEYVEKEIATWTGDLVAKIEILRRDRDEPFRWEVDFSEYNQENEMWFSKPKTMIKKVVIGQGFRMCFPLEMGDLPYIDVEMGDPATYQPHDEPESTAGKKPASRVDQVAQKVGVAAPAPENVIDVTPDEAPDISEPVAGQFLARIDTANASELTELAAEIAQASKDGKLTDDEKSGLNAAYKARRGEVGK